MSLKECVSKVFGKEAATVSLSVSVFPHLVLKFKTFESEWERIVILCCLKHLSLVTVVYLASLVPDCCQIRFGTTSVLLDSTPK